MSINGRAYSEERVSDCLHRLFPSEVRSQGDGKEAQSGGENLPYFAFPNPDGSSPDAYVTPPVMPADVFAAAGYVLQNSGAYHHVIAHVKDRGSRPRRQIEVMPEFIARARAAAVAWRAFTPLDHFDDDEPSVFAHWLAGDGGPMNELYSAWTSVWKNGGEQPIFTRLTRSSEPPAWWESALFLLIASDEASRDFGFVQELGLGADEAGKKPWFFTPSAVVFAEAARKSLERAPTTEALGTRTGPHPQFISLEPIGSISGASQDVVCVLPKARTTGVGCTLRSLSHHLALLPPRGIARAKWTPYLFEGAPPDERHMNLLLVPFPYSIPAARSERAPMIVCA